MFKFGLYKEGLRRTKVFGVIVLAAMIIGAVLMPVVSLYQHHNRLQMNLYQPWFNPILTILGADVVTVMAVAAIIATPLLVLSVFSWLNSRNSSDFYHAIPHKRETLFTSFLAAVLTWTVGAMWITTLIATIIYTTSPHTNVNFGSILIVLIGFTIVILLITGGVSLAMTFTGTVFSNIATAALILFFPRGLIAFYTGVVADSAGIISTRDFGFISDHGRNLLFGMVNSSSAGQTLSMRMLHGLLYTFILAAIYLFTAVYLFKKRHSEIATHAGTKISQPITRIIVVFIITMPVLAGFLSPANWVDVPAIIVFYAIAIIAYFAYEFITARKVPSLLHASKGLVFVAILNLLFIGAVTLNVNFILREIDTTRVASVQIEDMTNSWSVSYAELHQRELVITERDAVTTLANTLNHQIQHRQQDGRYTHWHWSAQTVRLTFTMDNGRTMTRNLRANPLDGGYQLQNFFRSYEPYLATYLLVPTEFEEISSWQRLTQEQYQNVLGVLREELQTVDIHEWHERVGRLSPSRYHNWIEDPETGEWFDPWQTWREEVVTEITVRGEIDGQRFWSTFPLTEQLTPRTLALYRYYLGQIADWEHQFVLDYADQWWFDFPEIPHYLQVVADEGIEVPNAGFVFLTKILSDQVTSNAHWGVVNDGQELTGFLMGVRPGSIRVGEVIEMEFSQVTPASVDDGEHQRILADWHDTFDYYDPDYNIPTVENWIFDESIFFVTVEVFAHDDIGRFEINIIRYQNGIREAVEEIRFVNRYLGS